MCAEWGQAPVPAMLDPWKEPLWRVKNAQEVLPLSLKDWSHFFIPGL